MSDELIGVAEIRRKYEILDKMGEGGMGAIYKVRHILLDEVRVIKLIRSQFREDPELQARFLREARVATKLRHPNVAAIYDFSTTEDGTAYLVMEFIDGLNLAEQLERDGALPIEEVIEVSRQTLSALGYLHRQQIVHRDISPDNIMITRDSDGQLLVKLIDLGIAKPLDNTQWKTRTGMFVGKVRYISPEQLGGGDQKAGVDGRSDLYSFGVVLYQLLTGQFPIVGSDQMSLIAGHLIHPPRPFAESDPEGLIPDPLRATVMRAFAKRPEDRFQSAQELSNALTGLETSELPVVLPAAHPAPVLLRGSTAATVLPATATTGAATFDAATTDATVLTSRQQTDIHPATGPAVTHQARGGALAKWLGAALVLLVLGAGLAWRADLFNPNAAKTSTSASSVPAGIAFGTYHALVIGNDAYAHLPTLETAVFDAREIARVLEQKYGFQVTLLTDATRSQILNAITDIAQSLTRTDNLLIYYAGHGWLDERSQSGYWQPVDAEIDSTANWISTRYEISAVLEASAARQLLVIADSCYAGALTDPSAGILEAPRDDDAIEQALERRSRLALTSGGLSPVLDQGSGGHSVFSAALLDVLSENPGVLATATVFSELGASVVAAAARYGVEQDPQLAPITDAGDEGGEFFFVADG